jgi:2-O-(6-phospho-alpha-D-mannosyl)-D-glycerate hydrolase
LVNVPRRFLVVPHTHWDREWYEPFEHFRLWLGHVVDGVIETLERDPAFSSFTLDGQAIVLEDYLDVRPENEARLRMLLESGRIEVGPSYVLPDEFLVGPEPLVRNLLIGRQVCERFGVAPAPVGYMPDSFGHPNQVPQILRGFGLSSFIFSRGMGDQLDDVGVVFQWEAPDGSTVLALQQLPHYGNFAQLADADDGARRIDGILEQFGGALERAGVGQVLLCNGSDHLPIQPEMPAICDELERRFPERSFTISSYADYVRSLDGVEVPSWRGELLGSRLQNVLRGVNSSRLYLKQANDRAERRLLTVETLAALESLASGAPFPREDFRLAWRELLRNHPHDSICGCSCDEAHRDMMVRYEQLDRTVWQLGYWAFERLGAAEAEARAAVFNPLPEARRALVELPGAEPQLVDLDGFEMRTVELTPVRATEPREGTSIESDRFMLEAAPDGTLTLTDKQAGRRHARLHVLEDEPDMGDLYNFCPVDGAAVWRSQRGRTRILADGPLIWELEIRAEAERPDGLDGDARASVPLTIVTVARLVRGSPRVEFRTTVENRSRDHRLRVVFSTGEVPGTGARHETVRAESPFAVVHRPLEPPVPTSDWTEPPDPTQHTLGAVALGPVALLAKGLPEYEARSGPAGEELCLTLLRCVGVISKPSGAIATRPQGAGPATPTPEGQCLGRHELEYALLVGADELDDLSLLRESADYRRGFVVVAGIEASLEPSLALTGDVVFSCLKGAEDGDGVILRCFNPSATVAGATVSGRVSVTRTRLDETAEEPLPDGTTELAPYQIATLRLRPEA